MAGRASAVELQRDSYLSYVPDLGGNTALAVIYTILAIALYYHLFFTGAKVDKWALCLPIGTTFEALGFYLRIPMRTQQHNMPLYTVMYLFVVLSPAAFLAFNYILFGRLVAALEGNKPGAIRHSSPYSFIPPRWVKRIFVVSDVCTFCVQAAGGGMQTSNDYKTSETGNNVFLGGVVGQGGECARGDGFGTFLFVRAMLRFAHLEHAGHTWSISFLTASYLLFTALTLVAHYRLLSWHGKRYAPTNLREPAVVLLNILYISSIGILVRSVYRIIEVSSRRFGQRRATVAPGVLVLLLVLLLLLVLVLGS